MPKSKTIRCSNVKVQASPRGDFVAFRGRRYTNRAESFDARTIAVCPKGRSVKAVDSGSTVKLHVLPKARRKKRR